MEPSMTESAKKTSKGNLAELHSLLKRTVEVTQPDLRRSYRIVHLGEIERTYPSDGTWWADVKVLRNDYTVVEPELVITRVQIPIKWGGKPHRGVVCPPLVGAYCLLEYLDGDNNVPFISDFLWHEKFPTPLAEINEYVTQYDIGIFYKFDPDGNWWVVAPEVHEYAEFLIEMISGGPIIGRADADIELAAGGDFTATAEGDALVAAANVTVAAEGAALIEAMAATVRALSISLEGPTTVTTTLGVLGMLTAYGMATVWGMLNVNGELNVTGDIKTAALNSLNNAIETINSRLGSLENAVRMLGGAV